MYSKNLQIKRLYYLFVFSEITKPVMNDILEKLYSLDPAISTLHKKYGILKAEREREREGKRRKFREKLDKFS